MEKWIRLNISQQNIDFPVKPGFSFFPIIIVFHEETHNKGFLYFGRNPGGTFLCFRKNPGGTLPASMARIDPRGHQEAPRRHPGGSQEGTQKHPEAPRAPQRLQEVLEAIIDTPLS